MCTSTLKEASFPCAVRRAERSTQATPVRYKERLDTHACIQSRGRMEMNIAIPVSFKCVASCMPARNWKAAWAQNLAPVCLKSVPWRRLVAGIHIHELQPPVFPLSPLCMRMTGNTPEERSHIRRALTGMRSKAVKAVGGQLYGFYVHPYLRFN